MENASKFLIIAGGILIGIIILSIFAYEISFAVEKSQDIEREMARTQTLKFNSQFTIYLGKEITPQEAATLINYVTEWNYPDGERRLNDFVDLKYKGGNLKYFIDTHPTNTAENFLLEYTKYNEDAEPKYYFRCENYEFNGPEGRLTALTLHLMEY